MKTKMMLCGAGILYLVLCVLIVPNSYKNAKQYPFDRLKVGNSFFYALAAEPDVMFGARYVECAGIIQGGMSTDQTKIHCIIQPGSTAIEQYVETESTGAALWTLAVLVLSSIILAAWGAGVYYARKDMFATLYALIAYAVSVQHILYIDVFFAHSLFVLFPMANAFLAVSILFVIFTLQGSPAAWKSAVLYANGAIGAVLAVIVFYKYLPVETVYLISIGVLIVMLIAAVTIILITYDHKKRTVLKRNSIIAGAIVCGGVLPHTILLAGASVDIVSYALLLLIFGLAVPIGAGSSLLGSYSLGMAVNVHKNLIVTVVDIICAVIIASGLFYIFSYYTVLTSKIIVFGLFIIVMLIILQLRMLIMHSIEDIIFLNNDEYALSLQRIIEIITSPKHVSHKFDAIEAELKVMIPLDGIRYAVGDDYKYDDSRVINVEPESHLWRFFTKRREIVSSESYFSHQDYQRSVETFFNDNDIAACIPVIISGTLHGILITYSKEGHYFTSAEKNYLSTLSLQVHQLIANDKALVEYIHTRSFEQELDVASYIQMRLFPKRAPQDCGMHFAIYSRPYLKVTGDYYNIVAVDKNRVAVVIADISGHGLSAAMMLSAANALIQGMLKEKKPIGKIIAELNHFLTVRYNGFELITLFIGLYDKRSRTLEYINAGHIAPLIVSKGAGFSRLDGRSKILGVDPFARYFASRYSFNPGDEIFLYTDGLTDLYDSVQDRYLTDDSLESIIKETMTQTIEEKIHAITKAVVAFGKEHIKDDITIVGMHID